MMRSMMPPDSAAGTALTGAATGAGTSEMARIGAGASGVMPLTAGSSFLGWALASLFSLAL